MSASPVFSSAASGRPFIFSPSTALGCPEKFTEEFARKTATKAGQILAAVGAAQKLAAVVPASRLEVRPSPEMVSSGIAQLDILTGGFPRGCLTEICGTASSGKTSIMLCALARATQRGEVCALVDTSDAFDPASAAAAGIEMNRLLWVRCVERNPLRKFRADARTAGAQKSNSNLDMLPGHSSRGMFPRDSYQGVPLGIPHADKKNFDFSRWELQLGQVLKVTDLLLQSNGFGMIALDLGDVPMQSARRIPLTSWFRFRRAVEHTPTTLLVLEQQPIAGSCSSMVIKVSANRHQRSGTKRLVVSPTLSGNQVPHSELLDQLEIRVQLLCSRLERKSERKPVQSTASFRSRAAWASG